VRRKCLDRLAIFGERHPLAVLGRYVERNEVLGDLSTNTETRLELPIARFA
jgi:hypothetical protein